MVIKKPLFHICNFKLAEIWQTLWILQWILSRSFSLFWFPQKSLYTTGLRLTLESVFYRSRCRWLPWKFCHGVWGCRGLYSLQWHLLWGRYTVWASFKEFTGGACKSEQLFHGTIERQFCLNYRWNESSCTDFCNRLMGTDARCWHHTVLEGFRL